MAETNKATPTDRGVFGKSGFFTAFLFVLLSLGLLWAIALGPGDWTSDGISERMGGVIGAVVVFVAIPLALGWIAYRIGRRSQKAARMTVYVCGGAMTTLFAAGLTLTALNRAVSQANNTKIIRQMQAHSEAAARQISKSVADNDGKAASEAMDGLVQDTKALAGQAAGDDKKLAEALAAWLERGNVAAVQSNAAMEKFWASGGVSVARPLLIDDLNLRLALLDEWERLSHISDEMVLDSVAREHLERAGVRKDLVDGAMRGYAREKQKKAPFIAAIRRRKENCDELIAQCRAVLMIFRDNFGKWSITQDGGISFSADVGEGIVAAYRDAGKKIASAQRMDAELLKEIADLGAPQPK